MTKTSTPTNLVNSTASPAEKTENEADQQNELFYNSIKVQLNELVKNPSDESIEKILAYAKNK